MACVGCSCGSSSTDETAVAPGCKSNGGCSTGGCNRLNTYDWLSDMEIQDVDGFDLVEVSFNNGARKEFFKNPAHVRALTGDWVVVDTGSGNDVGRITLSGELVRLQMKKKRARLDGFYQSLVRVANDRDLEKMREAKSLAKPTIVRARVISRTLDLKMKIGDVEYQADLRKATFFYTADGRVDFRELIRHYAKEFRVKVEMRQIGARQESARIGGIGSCGRELCCSTWLTNFKSVNTSAARYQNLAINQAKLSGQCGRLKCCLNYELDTYLEALEEFPNKADRIKLKEGHAILIKTDVFKRLMYYSVSAKRGERGRVITLTVDKVKELLAMVARGEFPTDLVAHHVEITAPVSDSQEEEHDYESVNDVIELPIEERKKRRRKKKPNSGRKPEGRKADDKKSEPKRTQSKKAAPKTEEPKKDSSGNKEERSKNAPQKRRRRPAKNNKTDQPKNGAPKNDTTPNKPSGDAPDTNTGGKEKRPNNRRRGGRRKPPPKNDNNSKA